MNFSLLFSLLLCFKTSSLGISPKSFNKETNPKDQYAHYFQSSKFPHHSESSYLYGINKHDEIPPTAISIPISNFQTTGWKHTSTGYFCEKAGQTLTITYRGTQSWIIGSTSNDFGSTFISFDNRELTEKTLFSRTNMTHVIYHVSPQNTSFGDHVITIVTKDDRRIEVIDIKYLPYAIESENAGSTEIQSKRHLAEYNGKYYVNISGKDFKYYPTGDWKIYPNYDALTESFCEQLNCSVSATFYGTKCTLKGNRHNKLGEIDIRIDGKFVTQINAFNETRMVDDILFESDELDYGKHTINLTNKNSKTSRMEISYILFWPLPKFGGVAKNFQTIKSEPSTSKTGYFGTENAAYSGFNGISTTSTKFSISFQFYGTKFWFSGTKQKSYKSICIKIDNTKTIPIDTEAYSYPGYSFRSINALIYQSEDLPLDLHTVAIMNEENPSTSISSTLELADFFYITQPKDATIVPDIQFQTANDVTANDDILSTNEIARFHMYGTYFWIFGQQLQDSSIDIRLNNAISTFEIQDTDSTLNFQMLTPLNQIEIDYNLMEIIKKGEIEVNFAYYLNQQQFSPLPYRVEIAYDSPEISSKLWNSLSYERDDIEVEGISTNDTNAILTIPFEGSQFWIEGSYDPSFGLVEIRLNGTFISAVSLYREEHHKEQIYYQSNNINYDNYELSLKTIDGKEISFNKLYVLTPSYAFTLSSYFSGSQSFSKSTEFTKSTDFTTSGEFTQSKSFSFSEEFSNSEKFSGSSRFTPSMSFTTSNGFTISSIFSFSGDFTESISFTLTASDLFTQSVSFSESNSLISIEAATEKPSNPNQLNDKSNPLSAGLIVGIVVAILVVILAIILVIILLRRRDNRSNSDIDSFECSANFPNTTYDYTKDDPIEAADSFIPFDPFNQAIEEMGKQSQ